MRKLSFLLPGGGLLPAFRRFPVSIVCAVLLFLLFVAESHDLLTLESDFRQRLAFVFAGGYFLTGGMALFAESRAWSVIRTMVLTVPVLGGFAALMLLSPQWELYIAFILPAILLFVLVSPFINKRTDDDAGFYRYGQSLCLAFAVGTLAALLLMLGVSAAMKSVTYLFEIEFSSDIFSDIMAFCCALFAPVYALSWIPARMDAAEDEVQAHPAQRFMLEWVLAPLIAVYFLILYAYAVKIAAQWSLPRGQLAYMITGFGGVGIAVFLVSWPLRRTGGGLLRLVRRWFFPALILPALLMGLSIAERISAYGVTEQRYIIVMAVLWFLAVAVLFAARPGRLPMKVIPGMLAVLFVLAAFGPWGGLAVSARSQVARLEAVLARNGMLADGHAVRKETELSFADRKDMSSVLDYLAETKRDGYIHALFPMAEKSDSSEYSDEPGPERYAKARAVMRSVGQDYVGRWETEETDERWSMQTAYGEKPPMDVRGYDVYMEDNLSVPVVIPEPEDVTAAREDAAIPAGLDWPATRFTLGDNILRVDVAGRAPLSFALGEAAMARRAAELGGETSADPLVRDAESADLRGRLRVNSLTLMKNAKGEFRVSHVDFILLMARK